VNEPARSPSTPSAGGTLLGASALVLAVIFGCQSFLPWLDILDGRGRSMPFESVLSLIASLTGLLAGTWAVVLGFRHRRDPSAKQYMVLIGQILGGIAALFIFGVWVTAWVMALLRIPPFPSP